MTSKNNFILKRNLYENCIVKDLEGDVIFFCSAKRANWYLKRNLAAVINEDPFEIQLNFKTNGKGNFGDPFYLQHRKNICVVCGTNERLTKHHVIPFAFRKYLPDNVKNHSYHDILLLCVEHHEEYERYAYDFKKRLAKEYGAPLDGVWITDSELHTKKFKARMIARSLKAHYDKIPPDRRDYLIEKIRRDLNIDKDTPYINIEAIASMPLEDPGIRTQGEIVVSALTNVEEFLIRWRRHFIETMQPKHLPKHWSIERGTR